MGETCFVRKGDMLLIPSTNHWDHCICDGEYDYDLCNKPDILTGLFYFTGETINYMPKTLKAAALMRRTQTLDPENGDLFINERMYNLSRATIDGAYPNGSIWKTYRDNEVVDIFNKVCPIGSGCGMIVIESWDTLKFVNDFNFRVENMSCVNSYYFSNSFEDMIATQGEAFALIESYYVCTLSLFDNIIYSVGISTGNASVGCSLIMFALFLLLGRYLRYTQGYRTGFDKAEEERERKEAGDILEEELDISPELAERLQKTEARVSRLVEVVRAQKKLIRELCNRQGIDLDSQSVQTVESKFQNQQRNKQLQAYLEEKLKTPGVDLQIKC
jgi:hypothetical protein